MQKISIPAEYKNVLDRGDFEFASAVNNVVFLLSQHATDENADFLESELFDRVEDRAEYTAAQGWTYTCGVMINLLGYLPDQYTISREYEELQYVAEG